MVVSMSRTWGHHMTSGCTRGKGSRRANVVDWSGWMRVKAGVMSEGGLT